MANGEIRKILYIFMVLTAFSCAEKQSRKGTSGHRDDTPNQNNNNNDATVGGTAMSLQQCNSQGKSWIAVVNNGAAPPACGGALAPWGCCEAQVLARFPSLATDLQQRIQTNTGEGYTLYNCEADAGTKATRLHFVKFPGSGATEYRNLDVTAFMTEPAADVEQCPQVPAIPNMPTSGGPTTTTTTSSSSSGAVVTQLKFAQDVSPILTASCSNGDCHKAGDTYVNFVGDEAVFTTVATQSRLRVCRTAATPGVMPPATSPLLDANKTLLLKYIDQVNGVANSTGTCP